MFNLIFQNPVNAIYAFIALAIVFILFFGMRKKNIILEKFKLKNNREFLIAKFVLSILGLSLIVISLLGPVKEDGLIEVNGKGLDIFILIDTSKSMLAEDILPSRIERAKKISKDLLGELEGDRVGFIPFSSSAYVQMPLTVDYALANMFLDVMDTDMISGGGSDVGNAISLAIDSFDNSSIGDKVILILSDGEENDNDAYNVISDISNNNLKIFTIGIGTSEGGLIPMYDNGQVSYKKDNNGEFVVTKLNTDLLQEIASSTSGSFYKTTADSSEIHLILQDIKHLKRGTLESKKIKSYKHYYQYFLAFGILLILIAYKFPERR